MVELKSRRVYFVTAICTTALYLYSGKTLPVAVSSIFISFSCRHAFFFWWERRESNSQSFRHMFLRHTCIPIPPRSHIVCARSRCFHPSQLTRCQTCNITPFLAYLVCLGGFEPPRLAALGFEPSVSTVPPQTHIWSARWELNPYR